MEHHVIKLILLKISKLSAHLTQAIIRDKLQRLKHTQDICTRQLITIIEIINNTRGGIVIFFTDNKRERVYWGANSSPGCRARRLLAELILP